MLRKIPPSHGKKGTGTSLSRRLGRKPPIHFSKRQERKEGRGIWQTPPRKGRSGTAVLHQELPQMRISPGPGWHTL